MNRDSSNFTEIAVDAPKWAMGAQLIQLLKKIFDAQIIYTAEGPDSRRWTLLIRGKNIIIDQWDTGDISIFVPQNDVELLTLIKNAVKDINPP